MAVAKGIALACHLPIIGIPTLDIVAESQPVSLGITLAAILQAGRGRLVVGWYTAEDGRWQLNPPIEIMDAHQAVTIKSTNPPWCVVSLLKSSSIPWRGNIKMSSWLHRLIR